MNQLKKLPQLLILTIFLAATTLSGCEQENTTPPDPLCPTKPCPTEVNLTVWRLFDDRETLQTTIDAYSKLWDKQSNTTINIEYKKVDFNNYEEKLIKALAAGKGPDIFQIHNDWLPKYWEIISPIPEEIMTVDKYQETFVPVAAEDFIFQEKAYAIPLYVDTLALFYNEELLKDQNYFSPPATWEQLEEYSQTLTVKQGNNVDLAGITMGTANNINRASDILYALMLQNGTVMTSPDNTTSSFALPTKTPTGENFYPGESSLDFYTSFADPANTNYTWNPSMLGSIESFEKGLSAMTINYAYQIPIIDKFKDPDVHYEVTNLPQLFTTDDPVSYANYWGETVSLQSKNAAWAWDFLKYTAENGIYTTRTKKPTSLKSTAQSSSIIFDRQAYYAKSFYKIDANRVDAIFTQMIDDVAINNIPSEEAINKAQNDISDIMLKAKEEQL
ncbi:MAG: extracellular solute-binding protein [Patescibacteria group bacterium]